MKHENVQMTFVVNTEEVDGEPEYMTKEPELLWVWSNRNRITVIGANCKTMHLLVSNRDFVIKFKLLSWKEQE